MEIVNKPAATTTVAQFLADNGIVAGDIFTVVGLGVIDPQGAFASQYGQLASQPSCSFGFIRLKVKTAAFSSTACEADGFIHWLPYLSEVCLQR